MKFNAQNRLRAEKEIKEKIMKSLLAVFLCVAVPSAVFAGDTSFGVTYDGGSIETIKAGTGIKMYIETKQVRFVHDKQTLATVPAIAITEISYGQDVHRRVGAAIGIAMISFGIGALMLLVKSKKHFVGVTWSDADQKGGLAVQCDKNEYRGILAGLEGISGKKAVDSSAMTVKN
jgi:hypothetical protein